MTNPPLIQAENIVRTFGHVQALNGANLSLHEGEIVALIGDNGAGKSSLVRILSGSDQPTSGTLRMGGAPTQLNSPRDAQAAGMETVYQDLALAPDLDAAANIFLGRELLRGGLLGKLRIMDKPRMVKESVAAIRRLNVSARATTPVHNLSGGQQQGVAITRADLWATKAILMDEPTAALGVVQSRMVLDLIRRVRDAGKGVIVVSHNMIDVLELADRIVVLRLGKTVGEFSAGEATVDDLVIAMTSGTIRGKAA
jgi:simple sugar transport system ATP-binding protein